MAVNLSTPAFERATEFLREQARPLERAQFEYHFKGGGRTAVLAALVPYQNPDGGFGHALEPDIRAGASSVIATITALAVMRDINADEDTPGLPAALTYLIDAYDVERERWPIVPPEVEEAPHAPWWTYAETEEAFHGFWANPRASVIAYLQQFQRLAPSPFLEVARQSVVDDLMRYPQRMEMNDLLCFIDLLETNNLPRETHESILDKLRRAVPASVEQDPQKWMEYVMQPLQAVRSPHSPLTGTIDAAVIDANLDFMVAQQGADGAWSPVWSWDFVDAAAWAAAKREWKGVLTLNNLITLRDYGRLAV